MKHRCPVCGFDGLTSPARDYKICPCCGTEFGYDDLNHSSDELRERWLAKGAPWFSKHTAAPKGWDALAQLAAAGLAKRESSPRHVKT
jgi:hypothetical protein